MVVTQDGLPILSRLKLHYEETPGIRKDLNTMVQNGFPVLGDPSVEISKRGLETLKMKNGCKGRELLSCVENI